MRQASWIAFLLLTVGLLSYEAAIGSAPEAGVSQSIGAEQPTPGEFAEGGGDFPPKP